MALAHNLNLYWLDAIYSLYPGNSQGLSPTKLVYHPKAFLAVESYGQPAGSLRTWGCPGPFAKLPRPSMAGNSHDSQCGLSLLLQDPVKAATTHGSLCSIDRVALSDQRQWLTLACLGTPPEEPQNQHIQRLASDHSRASQSGTSKG